MGNKATKEVMANAEQIREDVRAIREKTNELADRHMLQLLQREMWTTNMKLDRILILLTDNPGSAHLLTPQASSLVPPQASSLPPAPRPPGARACSPRPTLSPTWTDVGSPLSALGPSPLDLSRADTQAQDLTLPKSSRSKAPFSRSGRKSRSYQNLANYLQADGDQFVPAEVALTVHPAHVRTDEEGYVCPSY